MRIDKRMFETERAGVVPAKAPITRGDNKGDSFLLSPLLSPQLSPDKLLIIRCLPAKVTDDNSFC